MSHSTGWRTSSTWTGWPLREAWPGRPIETGEAVRAAIGDPRTVTVNALGPQASLVDPASKRFISLADAPARFAAADVGKDQPVIAPDPGWTGPAAATTIAAQPAPAARSAP